jgi:hypothetical protein
MMVIEEFAKVDQLNEKKAIKYKGNELYEALEEAMN